MKEQGKIRFGGRSNILSSVPTHGVSLIEVADNRRVLIENHFGVTSYGQNSICVKVRRGIIEISGDKLEILCMSRERIVICGVIGSIQLWGGEK